MLQVAHGIEPDPSCVAALAAHRSRTRVLLYSHDTFGLGHLRRNLAIAGCLLEHPGQFEVSLLSGSPVIHDWHLPPGLKVQPLPPVVKVAADRYVSRDRGRMFGLVKGYREALILKQVMNLRPDVLLVDHAPAGMNGELLPTLAMIRHELPSTRVVLGLRDIIDSPDNVAAAWAEQEVPALIEQAYHDVLVYGSEALFDVVREYALPLAIARRVRYCGHVVEAAVERLAGSASGSLCGSRSAAAGRRIALVTAGGGGDGAFLMEAYLEALQSIAHLDLHSVLVLGPLMPDHDKSRLRHMAESMPQVEVHERVDDMVANLKSADLVVAMAGYNTTAEIIANHKRAILVPRTAPRAEQQMRAQLLAKCGLVRCVEPGDGLPDRLAAAVEASMAERPPDATHWRQFSLDGARQVREFLLTSRGAVTRRDP